MRVRRRRSGLHTNSNNPTLKGGEQVAQILHAVGQRPCDFWVQPPDFVQPQLRSGAAMALLGFVGDGYGLVFAVVVAIQKWRSQLGQVRVGKKKGLKFAAARLSCAHSCQERRCNPRPLLVSTMAMAIAWSVVASEM